jgi:hypothetical protein
MAFQQRKCSSFAVFQSPDQEEEILERYVLANFNPLE